MPSVFANPSPATTCTHGKVVQVCPGLFREPSDAKERDTPYRQTCRTARAHAAPDARFVSDHTRRCARPDIPASAKKYEKGMNRIGAGRLQRISEVLHVPLDFFFEGAPHLPGQNELQTSAPFPDYVSDYLATSEGLQHTEAFIQIKNAKLRAPSLTLSSRSPTPRINKSRRPQVTEASPPHQHKNRHHPSSKRQPSLHHSRQRQPDVVHGAFGFDRGAAFFLCLFATDLAAAFARARAALLAAARLSGDHGVY
jgi:transcriptional regulator with XRE-family HTH domain